MVPISLYICPSFPITPNRLNPPFLPFKHIYPAISLHFPFTSFCLHPLPHHSWYSFPSHHPSQAKPSLPFTSPSLFYPSIFIHLSLPPPFTLPHYPFPKPHILDLPFPTITHSLPTNFSNHLSSFPFLLFTFFHIPSLPSHLSNTTPLLHLPSSLPTYLTFHLLSLRPTCFIPSHPSSLYPFPSLITPHKPNLPFFTLTHSYPSSSSLFFSTHPSLSPLLSL